VIIVVAVIGAVFGVTVLALCVWKLFPWCDKRLRRNQVVPKGDIGAHPKLDGGAQTPAGESNTAEAGGGPDLEGGGTRPSTEANAHDTAASGNVRVSVTRHYSTNTTTTVDDGKGGVHSVSTTETTTVEVKYSQRKMQFGSAETSNLKDYLGFANDEEYHKLMMKPLEEMEREWQQNGDAKDQANFNYVTRGVACNPEFIPEHVKETFRTGKYHGGDIKQAEYDQGHDMYTLETFVQLPQSKQAKLQDHHVAALRMYTTDSYGKFNKPLREGTKPHPFKVNVMVLNEALRQMRSIEAHNNREGYASRVSLYRGMSDIDMDVDKFKREGGNELAFMSTSGSMDIARAYAAGAKPGLLFRFNTVGHSRGIRIQYLSVYPKEDEYLYPPLTNLTFDVHSVGFGVWGLGCLVVPLLFRALCHCVVQWVV